MVQIARRHLWVLLSRGLLSAAKAARTLTRDTYPRTLYPRQTQLEFQRNKWLKINNVRDFIGGGDRRTLLPDSPRGFLASFTSFLRSLPRKLPNRDQSLWKFYTTNIME